MHKSNKKKRKRGKNGNNYCHQPTQTERGGKNNSEPRTQEKRDSDIATKTRIKKEVVQDDKQSTLIQDTSDDEYSPNLPYAIKNSNVMGRYLVAARDLQPGEIIISADPLVVGPCSGCDIICLGCYQPINNKNIFKCSACEWPLCSPNCSGLHQHLGHSTQECQFLAAHCRPDHKDLTALKNLYLAIVPLRCLLLKSCDPEKWEAVNKMVAHNDIRIKKKDLWRYNQTMVVDRIRLDWGMPEYSEDEIHTVCGILEVNAFEVGPIGASLRALYPRAFLLAHDCTPNTTHTDDARRHLDVRAARPIRRGQAITLSYAYTLQSTHKRREHLLQSKFFECTCDRCSDPLELGTYAGALLCPRCTNNSIKNSNKDRTEISRVNNISSDSIEKKCSAKDSIMEGSAKDIGVVVPLSPLDSATPWKCDTCPNYTLSASLVETLVQKMTDEYDAIGANDVEGFEGFLRRYRNVLHPNHCLCLSAKLSLSQLYGKVETHLIHKMSPSQLELKRDICRDILKVFDVLEPGFSRLRGTTLYELHAPLMVLTTRDYENRQISKSELRTRLKEVARCLNESSKILSIEPKDSSEGIMATAAKDALKQMKDWERIIGKIL